jgi:hypothetical protein
VSALAVRAERVDRAGGRPTLEEAISSVWEGLLARAIAACPVCGGDMHARYGAGARPVAGRCSRCASELR